MFKFSCYELGCCISETLIRFCSVLSVHLTSSKSLVGIVGVASEIQKEKKVHDYLDINNFELTAVLRLAIN